MSHDPPTPAHRGAARGGRPGTHPAGGREAGFTLIELMMGMMIMGVAMAIVTAGVLQIYTFVNGAESAAIVQSRLNVVLQRLDKEVRYAAGISTPAYVGDDQYVEFLTTATGTATCTELRLQVSTGHLQRRSWPQGSIPPSTGSILAVGVSGTQPFTVTDADDTVTLQRLTLALVFSSPAGRRPVTQQLNITFTAMNSTPGVSRAAICTEGRSTTWNGTG